MADVQETNPAGQGAGLVPDQFTIAKDLEDWFQEVYHYLSFDRAQEFKALVERVRSISRPISQHSWLFEDDLNCIRAVWPNTALKISNELNRLKTLLEDARWTA